jgi:hypothetical protein
MGQKTKQIMQDKKSLMNIHYFVNKVLLQQILKEKEQRNTTVPNLFCR